MDYIVISLAALFASGLTLFSGFGLGTILLPVFAFFFPIEIAITLTAIVHLLNNFFKLGLMFKFVDIPVAVKFGVPAIIFAFAGAMLLTYLSKTEPIASYILYGRVYRIELVKVVIAVLILIFAMFELIPALVKLAFNKKYIPLGGAVSGFFGGLSGHQGALRSAFLIRLNLSKESFIATGVIIACLIDVTRISVYSSNFFADDISKNFWLLVAATLSAFIGAYFGRMLLKKITFRFIQIVVGVMLIIISIGLGLGII